MYDVVLRQQQTRGSSDHVRFVFVQPPDLRRRESGEGPAPGQNRESLEPERIDRGRALGGMTTAFFLGQFASPFYSLPLAEHVSLGGAFVITGYWLAGLGVFFIALALAGRRRRLRHLGSAGGP